MKNNFYVRYCATYLAVSFLFSAINATLYLFANIDLPSATNMVIAMVSGILPGSMFAKDYSRAPDKTEKRRFALGALAGSIALSLIILTLMFTLAATEQERNDLVKELQDIPLWIMALITVIVLLIYYFASLWGFKLGNKNQLKAVKSDKI